MSGDVETRIFALDCALRRHQGSLLNTSTENILETAKIFEYYIHQNDTDNSATNPLSLPVSVSGQKRRRNP